MESGSVICWPSISEEERDEGVFCVGAVFFFVCFQSRRGLFIFSIMR